MLTAKTCRIVVCSSCTNVQELYYYPVINISRDPFLKSVILKGKLHQSMCQHCNENIKAAFDFTYFDPQQKVILRVQHEAGQKDYEYEAYLKYYMNQGYIFRIVHSLSAMAEKILIFDSKINDIALEEIKQYLLTGIPGLHAYQLCLQFKELYRSIFSRRIVFTLASGEDTRLTDFHWNIKKSSQIKQHQLFNLEILRQREMRNL